MLDLELPCDSAGGKRFSPKNPWIAFGGFIKPARRVPGLAGPRFFARLVSYAQAAKEGRIKPKPLYDVVTWQQRCESSSLQLQACRIQFSQTREWSTDEPTVSPNWKHRSSIGCAFKGCTPEIH